MTPEKRARLDEDEVPLDLSVEKPQEILTQPGEAFLASPVVESNRPNTVFAPPAAAATRRNIPESLLAIERQLTTNVEYGVRFGPPVEYVYNPIEYAFDVHAEYARRYCGTQKKVLFLGMNAGPWGMSQTGVPFGEINAVAHWLRLSGFVGKPAREHPARRVTGFACRRSEVSGKRFWSLLRELCGKPENFFCHSFLRNYCPVALMDGAGRNVTPAELKGTEQRALRFFCDEALVAVVKLLGVEKIVSVGRFAEGRARAVVAEAGLCADVRKSLYDGVWPVNVFCTLHPPSEPEIAEQRELG